MFADSVSDVSRAAGRRALRPRSNMIGWVLVVVGGLIVAFFYAKKAMISSDTATPAYVGFEPAELDLGTHLWKQKVQFSLDFVNRSDEPISLASLGTSCGCTFIDSDRYKEKVIAPSETLTIDVELETQDAPGRKNRTVTLVSADGNKYTTNVRVDVKATYLLESGSVNFGALPEATSPVRRSVSFISDSVKLVGEPRIDGRWLSAVYVKKDDDQTDIVITAAPDRLAYGLNVGSILIQTSDETMPRASIRVMAKGGQALRPSPPHVFLRIGETKTVKFVDAVSGSKTRIDHATSDNKFVHADIDDDGSVLVRGDSGAAVRFAIVRVNDSAGRIGKVLVSTFEGE